AADYRQCGPYKDFKIQPQRPVIDVLQIHPDPIVKFRYTVPATDLPQASDTGADTQFSFVPQLVSRQLVRKSRPGPYETHVAFQHAPQLGQFVKAVLSQKSAERRHSRVILDLEDRTCHLVQMHQV